MYRIKSLCVNTETIGGEAREEKLNLIRNGNYFLIYPRLLHG